MAFYLTKVWGFSVPCGPLQFSTRGWRNRAREKLSPGDLVVLVGTKEPPTTDEEQGRLLGIMEPTTNPVMSLDFPLETFPHDFTEQGYRWPYGLLKSTRLEASRSTVTGRPFTSPVQYGRSSRNCPAY